MSIMGRQTCGHCHQSLSASTRASQATDELLNQAVENAKLKKDLKSTQEDLDFFIKCDKNKAETVRLMEEEIEAYREYFQKISLLCMPDKQGHYRRGTVPQIMSLTCDAQSWYARERTFAIESAQ